MEMRVLIFGNIDYKPDSLPIKLLPDLKKRFPDIEFIITDPNELNIPAEKKFYIIDTVRGLEKVTLLSLEDIKKPRKNWGSLHSFDLGTHLFWIKKLKKDIQVKIIGVPPDAPLNTAFKDVVKILMRLR